MPILLYKNTNPKRDTENYRNISTQCQIAKVFQAVE